MEETTTAEIDRLAKIYSESNDSIPPELITLVNAIVRASETAPSARETWLPQGYLSLRQIEDSLDRRMWAGFGSAEIAKQFLQACHETGKRKAGFAPRRKRVMATLRSAFFAGELKLYVLADEASLMARYRQVPAWAQKPIPLPRKLLGRVFVQDDHGRMPATFAIRPSRKLAGSDRLFAILNGAHQLVVREDDFRRWFRSERRKRRWPSQGRAYATPKRKPVGRPSKLNTALKAAILTAGQEAGWTSAPPVTELRRLLIGQGLIVPSVDTLGRIMDALFAETGEPWLGRRRRVRRR
jgi:hypothetical protein